jgi:mono/diheme cytochrome c family protein
MMMKLVSLVAAFFLFGLSPVPNPAPLPVSGQDTPAATNPVKPTAESQAKAKKTYGYDCVMCHGESGDGKTDLAKDMSLTMTDLSDPKTLATKSDQDIFDIIRKGKDKMPAETVDRAKDNDVWNLVTYVRGLAKK